MQHKMEKIFKLLIKTINPFQVNISYLIKNNYIPHPQSKKSSTDLPVANVGNVWPRGHASLLFL